MARIAGQLKQEHPPAPPKEAPPAAGPDAEAAPARGEPGLTAADYPLMEKHPELVRTPTGKSMDAVTMEAVRRGEIQGEDLRISREMLLNQADIAASAGKTQVAENLRRAAELTGVPDDKVIEMYDMLRPNRATKKQLEQMAAILKDQYGAARCAELVLEAAAVYEKRGILLP